MTTKKVILIVVLVVVLVFAITAAVIGMVFFKNDKTGNKVVQNEEKYYISLDDMYCNIKDSKRILKVRVTVEVSNKKSLKNVEEKQFLVRNKINEIIRSKTEDDLQGTEGQIALQKGITNSLVQIFDDENITNVYFDELILQ